MAVSNNQDPQTQNWLGTFTSSVSSLSSSVWGMLTSSIKEPEKHLPVPQKLYSMKPIIFRNVESTATTEEAYQDLKKQVKEDLRSVTDKASQSHLDSTTVTTLLMTVQQCITDDDFLELTRFTKNFPVLLTHFSPALGTLMDAYEKVYPDRLSPWEALNQDNFPGSPVQNELNIESQGIIELKSAAHEALDSFRKPAARAEARPTSAEVTAELALRYLDSEDYGNFIALYEQSAWLQAKLPLNKEHILLRREELQKLDTALASAKSKVHKSVHNTDCSLESVALQTAHKGSWDMLFQILKGYESLELAKQATAALERDDIDEVSRLVEQNPELKDACSIPITTLLEKWNEQKEELLVNTLHCRALLAYRTALMSERHENFKTVASSTGFWPHQLCNGRFDITRELQEICKNPAKRQRTDAFLRCLIKDPEWNGLK
ncbi:hypothetical protein [Endozoicomonas numazuensis]|uniref:Uncharacterized protein n=1 Tax=Endozoicomonas numazuensis TaxID=1137799 RepID=A0A081NKZ2_9GAMM|nr:hypothetical protein [Endozoicomonas numazuensis]KEQ19115.1 hypothetical protein GZ78_03670 [Endozoicomonas numazuensis]